jgi:acetyl esterase/lipase
MTISRENLARLTAWLENATGVSRALAGEGTWADARKNFDEGTAALFPSPEGVQAEMVDLDGVPTKLITPETVIDDRALFYMHGGGYVHGGVNAYSVIAGHYAKRLGARVYIPDYRQAPEHHFPIPIEDTFRAYRAVLKIVKDPSRLAISGDSAGGAMVVTIMRWARAAGIALPVAGVAISPWADVAHEGSSAKTRDGIDPICTTKFLDHLARTFLGNKLATDPDASPIHADVRGLAPTLIQMGENEVMLSGGIKLAERLADQRVRTTLEVWPEMFHVWHVFADFMPEAREALDNAATFIVKEFERAKTV